MTSFTYYVDGGSRGNPGPAAIGVLICSPSGSELESHAECIGESTNNQAEYRALIAGLDLCAKHTRRIVHCFCDSELVVRQMVGTYRLKDAVLRSLFHEAKQMEVCFERVVYQHTARTHQRMRLVDRLVNEALEGRFPKSPSAA